MIDGPSLSHKKGFDWNEFSFRIIREQRGGVLSKHKIAKKWDGGGGEKRAEQIKGDAIWAGLSLSLFFLTRKEKNGFASDAAFPFIHWWKKIEKNFHLLRNLNKSWPVSSTG